MDLGYTQPHPDSEALKAHPWDATKLRTFTGHTSDAFLLRRAAASHPVSAASLTITRRRFAVNARAKRNSSCSKGSFRRQCGDPTDSSPCDDFGSIRRVELVSMELTCDFAARSKAALRFSWWSAPRLAG